MRTVVFDGNHCLHRVLHVKEFDLSHNGIPTGGVYGFLTVVRNILTKFVPDRCIVCWDGGIPKFRFDLCPGYKSGRRAGADDEDRKRHKFLFDTQKPVISHMLSMLRCINVERDGYEGDDVIAALTMTKGPKDICIVVSEDMDLAQLVTDNVYLYRPIKSVTLDSTNFSAVTETADVGRFLLRKAICGDNSDSIDGVDGIGNVRGTSVAKDAPYESLEQFFNWCRIQKSKPVARIAEMETTVRNNLKVVDLKSVWTAEELEKFPESIGVPGSFSLPSVANMMNRLGFASIMQALDHWTLPYQGLR